MSEIRKCEKAFDMLSRHFTLERLDAEFRKTEIALRRNFDVAVGNAHPELKKVADMVTEGEHGAGVAEAIRHIFE